MEVARLARDLRRERELTSLLETTEETTWARPALAIVRGDPPTAANPMDSFRSDAAAACARHRGGLELIASVRTRGGEALLRRAREFHRRAGATRYLREAEELLGTGDTVAP
jgi:hypothetical protein